MAVSIIYYTSNQEEVVFEDKIKTELFEAASDLPIISVSQKPIDFGENICVGEVGVSNYNAFRQLQIGAEAAKTDFVCTAESDYLYPKEYFNYKPVRDDVFYTPTPIYMIHNKKYYRTQRPQEGAMVVSRNYLIKSLKEMLGGKTWDTETGLQSLFLNKKRSRFHPEIPIITFKTKENMHQPKRRYTMLEEVLTLPYWGTAQEMTRKYAST